MHIYIFYKFIYYLLYKQVLFNGLFEWSASDIR